MKNRLLLHLAATAVLIFTATSAHAAPPDILQAANLKNFGLAAPTASMAFIGSNQPMNVWYPGEPVTVTIRFTPGTTLPATLGIGVYETGTRHDLYLKEGFAEMTPPPLYENLGARGTKTVAVKADAPVDGLPAGASEVTVPVAMPDRYGTYIISIAPNGKNPQFLCTAARIHKPKGGFSIDAPVMADGGQYFGAVSNDAAKAENAAIAYERLGFKFVRIEAGWRENADGTYDWTQLDKLMLPLAKHHIKLNVTLGAHPQNFMPYGVSPAYNYVVAPEMDVKLQKWVTAFCQRYWNNGQGALAEIENWNEPWEPHGISGWGSDSRRYRQIQKALADGARAVDPRIRLAASSSIMNTEDKFLTGDDAKEQISTVDDFTDHYVGPRSAYGPMVAKFYGKGSYETETWGAATELLVPQFVAMFTANGQSRVSAFDGNMSFITVPGNPNTYAMPLPIVTAGNFANAMLEDKPFVRMLSLTHAPTAYQYGEGANSVVLLLNKLRNFGYGADLDDTRGFLWPQWQRDLKGTMTIDNRDGALKFFDVVGNPEFVGQKQVTIPLDQISRYITAPKGGAKLISDRLNAARFEGAMPVEILAHDFTAPLAAGVQARVTLHNLLNRPISGTLRATAPAGITLKAATLPVKLAAGASADYVFLAADVTPNATNAYAFKYEFTGEGRTVGISETLSALVAKKGTKTIDGNLDDWAGDLPVLVSATLEKVDPTVRAWLPFADLKDKEADGSVGEVRMAWDDANLYLAARVTGKSDPEAHISRANWDEDQYFFGKNDDALAEPFRPYRKFVDANMNDAKVAETMKQDPQWAEYQKFLADNPAQASYLATNRQAIQAYFTLKDRDPNGSLSAFNYGYARDFGHDQPYAGDRFQFAFDTTPGYANRNMVLDLDRVPEGYHALPDTEYEYSVYPITAGGAETWRLLAPGVPRGHYFPHQERSKVDQGAVAGATSVLAKRGNVTTYEVAIPWTEIKDIKPTAGSEFGFTFQLGSSTGPSIQFGADKSATKFNGLTMHPYWENKPSAAVRWTLAP